MSARAGIFIAYCFAEKKWLDRVQTAIKTTVGNEAVTVWDERKLQASGVWKTELGEILSTRRLAILVVSDLFLESAFITRAKLPAWLETEQEKGLKICWVLASHCLFELAGLNELDAANDINQALDGLGIEKREAELVEIARSVSRHLGQNPPAAVPPPADLPSTLLSLDTAIRTRHESLLHLRRLARWLMLAALILGALALPLALLGLTHFLLLAGFAAFIGGQALLVRARIDHLGQGLLGMRYTRSGLADPALPSRQRDPLVRRAEELVG